MWKYNGMAIKVGRAWKNQIGETMSRRWASWSDADKTAAGMIWEDDPIVVRFDNRFYWSANNPRALDDVTDSDGNLTEGLKSIYKAKTKEEANRLLLATDWKIVKSAEISNYSCDQATLDWRGSVRTASNTIETAIDNAADLDAFIALFDTPVDDDNNPTGKAPINNFPDEL